MSDAPWSGNESLPLTMAQRVDAACNCFEQAWKGDRRPAIEDYLADLSEPERAALLRELVPQDIDYHRLAGEDPQPEEYHARFPVLTFSLASLFEEPVTGPPAPLPGECADLPAVPG
jgi:hypothetical protein